MEMKMLVVVKKTHSDAKEDLALRLPGQVLYLEEKRAEELIKKGYVEALEDIKKEKQVKRQTSKK